MRTSVSSRRNRSLQLCAAGFTLLEVLVVLVIMSIAVAVVSPGLKRTYDSVVNSGERADVLRQLGRLPLVARDRGGLEIAAGATDLDKLLSLPAGWKATPIKPLRVEASGACHASTVRIQKEGQPASEQLELRQPDCLPDER